MAQQSEKMANQPGAAHSYYAEALAAQFLAADSHLCVGDGKETASRHL
jgi:hypothetical protein